MKSSEHYFEGSPIDEETYQFLFGANDEALEELEDEQTLDELEEESLSSDYWDDSEPDLECQRCTRESCYSCHQFDNLF